MANDKTIEYGITADPSGFNAAMEKAAKSTAEAAKTIQGHLGAVGDMFGKLTGLLGGLTTVVAGGAAFKDVISESAAWNGEAKKLAVQLGVTTERASVMMVAMRHLGIDSDLMTTASAKLSKQVFSNSQAFEKMGIHVKDANGQYRPATELMTEVNQKLKEIHNPIEQNIAGMQVYGKSWQEMRPLLKLNSDAMKEAEEKARSLGLVVGEEGAAQAKKYKESMNDMKLVMTSLEVQMGNAVMPTFVKLGSWLSSAGPTAGKMMGMVMESLMNIMQTLGETVGELWAIIKSGFSQIGDLISSVMGGEAPDSMTIFGNSLKIIEMAFVGFKVGIQLALEFIMALIEDLVGKAIRVAAVVERALHGDFSGAKAAWQRESEVIEANWQKHMDKMVEISRAGGDKMSEIALREPKKPTAIKDGASDPNSPNFAFEKEGKDPSRMGQWEAKLADEKAYFQKSHDLREMSKQDELTYWKDILAAGGLTKGEQIAVSRKAAEVELEILKKTAADRKALTAEEIADQQKKALDIIAIDEEAAQHQYAMGSMTQAQLLEAQRVYLQQRFAIEEAAQEKRVELAAKEKDLNVVEYQKALDAQAALKRKQSLELEKLDDKIAENANQDWREMTNGMKSSTQSALAGMISGQMTWAKAMRNIWNGILQSFAQFISKKVVMWVTGENLKTGATVAGNATRVASDWWASGQSVLATAWAAVKNIAAKAWEVAASVYSAIASIPYVGPFLAPVMAIAATGAVLAFAGHVASAQGGYDIPAGVNPMTQLHEKEMVLPAKHADVIRTMAESGGGGGGGSIAPAIHVHAMDSHDVKRSLKKGGALHKTITELVRNGALK